MFFNFIHIPLTRETKMDGDCLLLIALVMVVFLIISYYIGQNQEYFDTYFNHDIGASDVIEQETGLPSPVNSSAMRTKYHWNDRDKQGLSIYDKYYEGELIKKSTTPDPGFNSFNFKDYMDNRDPEPVFTNFMGEEIHLSQKNY